MAAHPQTRRNLPLFLACGCVLSLRPSLEGLTTFIAGSGRTLPLAKARGDVSLNSFKDDFLAWRETLTDEEKALMREQTLGEYNKKFRKTETFTKDLPEEKQESLAGILNKFFDNEAEDYVKEVEAKNTDYDALAKRAQQKRMDFSLKNRVIEINRAADRRYKFATMRIREEEKKGNAYPQSSPYEEKWIFKNDDEESHKVLLGYMDTLKAMKDEAPADQKAVIDEALKTITIPPVGEEFTVTIPQVLAKQTIAINDLLVDSLEVMSKNSSESEIAAYKEKMPMLGAETMKERIEGYVRARAEVQADADHLADFFRSQKEMPGKTKADLLKEVWASLSKQSGQKEVPPIDEELLAEMAEIPATPPGWKPHSWGIADKLYKSEAIDAFGGTYLLGIYETPDEAYKAFDSWNVEYEQARADQVSEMQQWAKEEQARLDKDTFAQDRVKKIVEETKR